MKLILFKIITFNLAYLISSTNLGFKAPVFDNSIKEYENVYLARYGNQISCNSFYDPIKFIRQEEKDNILKSFIEQESFKELDNYVLKLKNNKDNKLIQQESFKKHLIRVADKDKILLAYSGEASIKIDSNSLNFFDPYLCCVEKVTGEENTNEVCSYLRFDRNVNFNNINLEHYNTHQSELDIKVYSIEKILLICGFLLVITLITFLSLAIYVNLINKKQVQNRLITETKIKPNVHTIALPNQIVQSNISIDDIYARYNLSNENYTTTKCEIDCNEFPPTYDQCTHEKSPYDPEDNNFKY